MTTTTISIEIDADAARAYQEASAAEQRNLQLLLGLRLRELTSRPARPLAELMDEIGQQAAARGLTSTTLDSMLHGDS